MKRARNTAVILLIAFGLAACAAAKPAAMSQSNMHSFLGAATEAFESEGGFARFVFNGVPMACVSDPDNNRMRLIAPIAERKALSEKHLEAMLLANYHSALDARYAIADGIVYAAFLHPLSTLSDIELASALSQVSELARNFGTTYSSGELSFGILEGQAL